MAGFGRRARDAVAAFRLLECLPYVSGKVMRKITSFASFAWFSVGLIFSGGLFAETGGPEQDFAGGVLRDAAEVDIADMMYQDKVLSDPGLSGAARADQVRKGGNVAIINQQGANNVSQVKQAGDNNFAEHAQSGVFNDILVEQRGKGNRSREQQTGACNRKVVVQNDSETIIEQVNP